MTDILRQLSEAGKNAEQISNELDALRAQVQQQSHLIAALVLENGGEVGSENWKKVHRQGEFIPYAISATETGYKISLRDAEVEE